MTRRTATATILLMLVLLSGCAPGGQEVGGESSGPTSLVFARGQDSVGLDPGREDDGESIKVIGNIYDTLVRFVDEKTVLEPALATSWEISTRSALSKVVRRSLHTLHRRRVA